jgi:hypothetical protein
MTFSDMHNINPLVKMAKEKGYGKLVYPEEPMFNIL